MSNPISPFVTARARGMLAVAALAMGGLFGYVLHQRSVVNHLSSENGQMVSMLKETRLQISSLSAKLDSLTPAQPMPRQESTGTNTLKPSPAHENGRRPVVAKHHTVPDSRLKHMQTQLDAQGKAIESTREELASTRTDLQGSIAKTHGELVTLQKKGERNYYEFDLDKSKQFQRTGPVGVSLRKASTKDMYADLKLRVDDADLSKKHVNLFEPVFFYLGDERRPVELVINSIRKNHIHGYISAPKFTANELAAEGNASSNSNDVATANNGQQQPAQGAAGTQRRKLEVPR